MLPNPLDLLLQKAVWRQLGEVGAAGVPAASAGQQGRGTLGRAQGDPGPSPTLSSSGQGVVRGSVTLRGKRATLQGSSRGDGNGAVCP